MAKNISNLPALEPFLIHQNESTNLDKMWQKWMEDFDIYLINGNWSYPGESKKGVIITLSWEGCKRSL